MTLSATRIRRCAVAAALGTTLLAAGSSASAEPMPLAEFSVDANQASWIPKETLPFDHMVLTLVTSPENEWVCCDEPVGSGGITLDLDEWGTGAYKYELYGVPSGLASKAAIDKGEGATDENGRPSGVVQARAKAARAGSPGPVQSGYFTYGVDPNAQE